LALSRRSTGSGSRAPARARNTASWRGRTNSRSEAA